MPLDPQAVAALIAVGGTAATAISGYVASVKNTRRVTESQRDQQIWSRRAEFYEELLATVAHQHMVKDLELTGGNYNSEELSYLNRLIESYKPLTHFALESRTKALASPGVQVAFDKTQSAIVNAGRASIKLTEEKNSPPDSLKDAKVEAAMKAYRDALHAMPVTQNELSAAVREDLGLPPGEVRDGGQLGQEYEEGKSWIERQRAIKKAGELQ